MYNFKVIHPQSQALQFLAITSAFSHSHFCLLSSTPLLLIFSPTALLFHQHFLFCSLSYFCLFSLTTTVFTHSTAFSLHFLVFSLSHFCLFTLTTTFSPHCCCLINTSAFFSLRCLPFLLSLLIFFTHTAVFHNIFVFFFSSFLLFHSHYYFIHSHYYFISPTLRLFHSHYYFFQQYYCCFHFPFRGTNKKPVGLIIYYNL